MTLSLQNAVCFLVISSILVPCTHGTEAFAIPSPSLTFDVIVYGSTPSGIAAAVSAARLGCNVALLSPDHHIGGMCTSGLGHTDTGDCADEAIGGFALEFFQRAQRRYSSQQQASRWNLEPHVAGEVFASMLHESGVVLLRPDRVAKVDATDTEIDAIRTIQGQIYRAEIFVDATYEGDLLARTTSVAFTWGREDATMYNESGAGGQGYFVSPQYAWGEFINPFVDGRSGAVLEPLLSAESPTPAGHGDHKIQAYNFRLCVTDDAKHRIPFSAPADYNATYWELLRRFWDGYGNSTAPHKRVQAAVPSGVLGRIPSSLGYDKYDMNNCGYNPVHTDMIGGSWAYPNETDYSKRDAIVRAHVSYTKGFLWFMSTDESVPEDIRVQWNEWGYCADEFQSTAGFPPQLYVREARRLVGDRVFTQNDVESGGRYDIGNDSVGLSCYPFDSHCEERYACADADHCSEFQQPYGSWACGITIHGRSRPNAGKYQLPLYLLLPKRSEATNLVVPVCMSASHVAYATVRLEPQYMILGQSAGTVAALIVDERRARKEKIPVQLVNTAVLHDALLQQGQKLRF